MGRFLRCRPSVICHEARILGVGLNRRRFAENDQACGTSLTGLMTAAAGVNLTALVYSYDFYLNGLLRGKQK